MASYGLAEPGWLTIIHVVYPAALAVIGWVLAGRIVTRRLDQ
jgi:lipooligosaccharide transport system permease protein